MAAGGSILDDENATRLAERLKRMHKVAARSTEDYDEASALTYGFQHMESSFRKILDEELPALQRASESSDEEIENTLHAIGEELRHILYHIGALKWYDYLGVSNPDA
jgi:hypothetical protein